MGKTIRKVDSFYTSRRGREIVQEARAQAASGKLSNWGSHTLRSVRGNDRHNNPISLPDSGSKNFKGDDEYWGRNRKAVKRMTARMQRHADAEVLAVELELVQEEAVLEVQEQQELESFEMDRLEEEEYQAAFPDDEVYNDPDFDEPEADWRDVADFYDDPWYY